MLHCGKEPFPTIYVDTQGDQEVLHYEKFLFDRIHNVTVF